MSKKKKHISEFSSMVVDASIRAEVVRNPIDEHWRKLSAARRAPRGVASQPIQQTPVWDEDFDTDPLPIDDDFDTSVSYKAQG